LFALACLLAVAATLCRQIGLCLPFAYAVVILFRSDDWSRKIYRSLVPVILCVLVFVAFNYWMKQTGRTPANPGELRRKIARTDRQYSPANLPDSKGRL
jgi:energy-coupling factor transporter transmembrane protein EcfT